MDQISTPAPEDTDHEAKPRTTYTLRFEGSTREYFGIWMVNVLLTIVTVGIYSAWAKVRTTRYFYGNTYLADSAFEYTADPVKILKGRLLAAGLFVAIQLAGYFAPAVSNLAFLALTLAFPTLLVLALRFRMHYTRWRGIRFAFTSDVRGAYVLFIPLIVYAAVVAALSMSMPAEVTEENAQAPLFMWIGFALLAAVAAAALLFPWWQNRYYHYLGNRTHFGTHDFSYKGGPARFYRLYGIALGLLVLGLVLAAGLGWVGARTGSPLVTQVITAVVFAAAYAAAIAYVLTARNNLVYTRTRLEAVTLESRLRFPKMFSLYLTNTLAIILTLGLAIPWAKIRMARYRADTFTVTAGSLDAFVGAAREEEQATAEGMSDVFAWDFGL